MTARREWCCVHPVLKLFPSLPTALRPNSTGTQGERSLHLARMQRVMEKEASGIEEEVCVCVGALCVGSVDVAIYWRCD